MYQKKRNVVEYKLLQEFFQKIFCCTSTFCCQKIVQYIRVLYPGRFILIESVPHKKTIITKICSLHSTQQIEIEDIVVTFGRLLTSATTFLRAFILSFFVLLLSPDLQPCWYDFYWPDFWNDKLSFVCSLSRNSPTNIQVVLCLTFLDFNPPYNTRLFSHLKLVFF